MESLELAIEALIFSSEQSITLEEIQLCAQHAFNKEFLIDEILLAVERVQLKYQSDDYPFLLQQIAGGYQFFTKEKYHHIIQYLHQHRNKKKLSQASLETLAIIASKQKVTKLEIEQIRGVNCDYTIQRLLEKSLIEISGKSDSVGKPILYSVSSLFLSHFGLNTIADMPIPKDIELQADGNLDSLNAF